MYNWILEFGANLEKRDMKSEPTSLLVPFKVFEDYCFEKGNSKLTNDNKQKFVNVDKGTKKIRQMSFKNK
jgi:hypothetical protein